jgi:hypothetical protein
MSRTRIIITIAGIIGIVALAWIGMRGHKPAPTPAPTPTAGPSQADGSSTPPAAQPVKPARKLTFVNGCKGTIWIASQPNAGIATKLPALVEIAAGKTYAYEINSKDGWAGRFWPKTGCDASGYNCVSGDSIPPCGGGTDAGPCEPPADTKVEFAFFENGGSKRSFYDISLVDGYSLPFYIKPDAADKTCVPTMCSLSLADCPKDEKYAGTDLGDLGVAHDGKNVQCLAPCKKWNYPAPYGKGQPEATAPGPALCCPSPVTPATCNVASGVKETSYVKLVHAACHSAYAYSYDDAAGSHDCPSTASFEVMICAEPAAH